MVAGADERSLAAVWHVLDTGAADVLNVRNPVDAAGDIRARLERWDEIDDIVSSPLVRDNLVGQSPVWICELRRIAEIARMSSANVLITGETGTGKELLARLIHTLDTRPDKGELVVVDCTTIVRDLSGSELFGHERGAFTGAVDARDGAFALANRGTLFLDEIGELSPGLQAQLLRAVQEHAYKRVGSNQWRSTQFRLVCATNRNLLEAVQSG